MITANRGGHNHQATGANGYVNEVEVDRLINAAVIKYLKSLGHNTNDVTPGNRDANSDLVYGVQMANEVIGADIFNSNHLNAHVTCKEPKGCECVTFGDNASVVIANIITDNLVKLGFKRRGNKVNKELYEVKATVMPSVIVEAFFCDSYADVQNYYRVGADEIGRAIAFGLAGKKFELKQNEIKGDEFLFMVFNNEWYVDQDPTLKKQIKEGKFKDGKDHYIKFGKKEKRPTCPQLPADFEEGPYLWLNSSVEKACTGNKKDFQNGAEHWLLWGYKEKREYKMPYGWSNERYLNLNPGLATAIEKSFEAKIGTAKFDEAVKEHWCKYGKNEGRKYK